MALTDEVIAGVRIAVEGCGHGTLHDIYAEVGTKCQGRGWDGVDVLIIGGDFQAVRNSLDLNCMHVPLKYREIGDFHEYYSGARVAPYLTLFVGGNHEASNHNFELFYGGWVAPNIYYMGAANVLRLGPLRIAGMSGIWKGYDYKKPHHERLPYNKDDVTSVYHTREIDVRKLRQIRTQVDVGVSHDWPRAIEEHGNKQQLFSYKPYFREDSESGKLGSVAARTALDHLRPLHWFSAHLHTKFEAQLDHSKTVESHPTKFRAHPIGKSQALSSTVPHNDTAKENVTPAAQSEGASEMIAQNEAGTLGMNAQNEEEIDLEMDGNRVPLTPTTILGSTDTALNGSTIPMRSVADGEVLSEGRPVKRQRTDGPLQVEKQQTGLDSNMMKNEDEVDLSLDDDDSNSVVQVRPVAVQPADQTIVAPQGSEDISATQANTQPESGPDASISNHDLTPQKAASPVTDDIRALLPDSFRKQEKAPRDHESKSAPREPDPPTAIHNGITHFLALSKCKPGQRFLDVVEIPTEEVVSPQTGGVLSRPFRLEYDPEWLAITRVFAAADNNHIVLGDPSAQLPRDIGRAGYLPLIEREEAWVEENTVKTGKLGVPENFVLTAPVYDRDVQFGANEIPREYSNPQTEAFCDLLQIPNPFKLSEQQIEERIEAGPRAATEYSRARGGGGRGGGGRGGRRGGREWGRGGGGRGGRGGNRGR